MLEIITVSILAIGIILAVGKYDYEKNLGK
jgi:hypothetical protein